MRIATFIICFCIALSCQASVWHSKVPCEAVIDYVALQSATVATQAPAPVLLTSVVTVTRMSMNLTLQQCRSFLQTSINLLSPSFSSDLPLTQAISSLVPNAVPESLRE